MLIGAVREGLCLDYANTLSWRGRPAPDEALPDPAALLAWLDRAAGLGTEAMRPARERARTHPQAMHRLFIEALVLREVIFRCFGALAAGRPAPAADVAALLRTLERAPARRRLTAAGGGYAWDVGAPRLSAPALLTPVLWSAGDLLAAAAHRRVRQCANPECQWLFVDESRTGTRRWCDMASCGNRAKARRHYARSRQHPPAS